MGYPLEEIQSFNPTLVRLRRVFLRNLHRLPEKVSIPRWFD